MILDGSETGVSEIEVMLSFCEMKRNIIRIESTLPISDPNASAIKY